MEELDRLLSTTPESLNLFSEGVVVGRVAVHLLSKHIAATPRLQLLELRGSTIGHHGGLMLAKGLDQHPSLTHLGLARNGLDTPALVAVLTALARAPLRHLDLEWNGVDNGGAAAVANLLASEDCELRNLSLERNDIRPTGAASLAAALRTNTTLRNLNLGFNRVGNGGATALAAALVESNATLLTLQLTNNDIGVEGGHAMARLVAQTKSLRSLNLQGNQCIATLFQRLEPSAMDASSDAFSDCIKFSDSLVELNLHSNKINSTTVGEDVGHTLQAAHALTALCLANTNAGDSAMAPILSGASFMTSLGLLDVAAAGMGKACIPLLADLVSSCPALHTLLADRNPLGVPGAQAIAHGLRRSSTITVLSLADCRLTASGVEAIAQAIGARQGLPLKGIYLTNNGVDTDSCVRLCEALVASPHQSGMEVLELSTNRISVRAASALLKLMERHTRLASVALRENPIADMLRCNYIHRALVQDYLDGTNLLAAEDGAGSTSDGAITTSVLKPTALAASAGRTSPPRRVESDDPDAFADTRATVSRRASSPPRGRKGTQGTLPVSPYRDEDRAAGQLLRAASPSSLAAASPPRIGASSAMVPYNDQSAISKSLMGLDTTSLGGSSVSRTTRLRGPAVDTTCSVAAADAIPGLAAVTPVPFADRRTQLHDFESNVAELCVTDKQLRLQFQRWDVNGDGFLSAKEFREHYLGQLVVPLPSDVKRVGELVKRYTRGDGRIYFDEFAVMMLRLATA